MECSSHSLSPEMRCSLHSSSDACASWNDDDGGDGDDDGGDDDDAYDVYLCIFYDACFWLHSSLLLQQNQSNGI